MLALDIAGGIVFLILLLLGLYLTVVVLASGVEKYISKKGKE